MVARSSVCVSQDGSLKGAGLAESLRRITSGHVTCDTVRSDPAQLRYLENQLEDVVAGYRNLESAAMCEAHIALAILYRQFLAPRTAGSTFDEHDPLVGSVLKRLEEAWVSQLEYRMEWPCDMPDDPGDFAAWYKSYVVHHPTSDHKLFRYLENDSTIEDVATFFRDESLVDGRFDDLVALAQLGQGQRVKMELAENYWDELGNGDPAFVHTTMFDNLLEELHCEPAADILSLREPPGWQSLASGNLLLFLVLHRRNSVRAIGALGAIEMVAPRRFRRLVTAMDRLGLPERARQYHELHIQIDARHGNGWLRNTVDPLVRESPDVRREIIAGTMMRFLTTEDHCDALYVKLTNKGKNS